MWLKLNITNTFHLLSIFMFPLFLNTALSDTIYMVFSDSVNISISFISSGPIEKKSSAYPKLSQEA